MRERLKRLWAQMDSARAAVWGVLVGFAVLGAAVIHGFERQDDTNATQEQDRIVNARSACETGNELRTLIREKLVEAPLEVGEAIIEAASANRTLDPAVVDEFRRIERERLERIAHEIPARRWDAGKGMCVDVEPSGEHNEDED